MNLFDPKLLQEYSLSVILLGVFLYWFYRMATSTNKDSEQKNQILLDERKDQNAIMADEREELKARVSSLEQKVDADGIYIRNELTKLLRENISAFATVTSHSVQVNSSLLEANQSFKDLQKTVGKIKKVQLKEDEE